MQRRIILRIGLCVALANPSPLRAAAPQDPAAHPAASATAAATANGAAPPLPADLLSQLPAGCLQGWSAAEMAATTGPPRYLGNPSAAGSLDHDRRSLPPQHAQRASSPPSYLSSRQAASQFAPPTGTRPPAYLPHSGAAAVMPTPQHDPLTLSPQRLPSPRLAAAPHRATDALAGDGDALLDGESLGGGDSLLDGDSLLGDDSLLDGDSLLEGGEPLDGGDPLMQMAPQPAPAAGDASPADLDPAAAPDPHHALLLENAYPSAQTCAQCHPRQYDEWRASGHAYAAVSPMFQRFEQTVTELTQGTVGYFCIRCHAPVATQLELPRSLSVLDAPPMLREGITCIACHRVNEAYGRTNGLRRVEPGDIYQPVYGPVGGQGVAEAIADKQQLKLKTDPADTGPGQPIHTEGRCFEPITRSDFCASCHQVAVHPGIALEVVHAQYRSGPAAAKGITCQDCHMGSEPGKPHGYAYGPLAELAGKPWGKSRRQANHTFWGPGYSIAHPGIFPHHDKADRWTARQWVTFDYRAGWGTEAFEQSVPADCVFPPPWDNSDERRDARRIIDANLQRAAQKRQSAIDVMQAGAHIEGPVFDLPPRMGLPLRFRYRVSNVSEGHNLPTGSLGAQPQVWLNVALVGPDGRRLWESGYLDTGGDLADVASTDVARGVVPRDAQLFNLQTKFLINNVKGTDREAALPLNFSQDQLVFFRPGAVPVSVLNHPPLIRMEARSIPPLGSRDAVYRVPAELMAMPGVYRLSVRLRSRPEPIYFMRQVGSSPEMIRRLNEGILDIHPQTHTFVVP